jgi:uncharacterized protein YcsI (UPF0317 family)
MMIVNEAKAHGIDPATLRSKVRSGKWKGDTLGVCPEYVHANLVIVHTDEYVADFFRLAQRNPHVFPILEVTNPGDASLPWLAEDADVTTDYPMYRVYRNGEVVDECPDIRRYWTKDSVAFLTGTTTIAHGELRQRGLDISELSVFSSNIPLVPSRFFRGDLAVTVLMVPHHQVAMVVQVMARYPLGHGSPVHIGDPSVIGVESLTKGEFGVSGLSRDTRGVPVFWATAATGERVAQASGIDMIFHKPGHWIVGDRRNSELGLP